MIIRYILLFVITTCMGNAALLFQADFNGLGTGTGGANDIVSFGGTGSLVSWNVAHGTITNSSASPFASGNYLVLNALGVSSYRNMVTFSAGSGLTALSYASGSTTSSKTNVLLNLAFDFYVRPVSVVDMTNWLRPIDIRNITNGGLNLIVNSQGNTSLRVQLSGNTGAFSTASDFSSTVANIYGDTTNGFSWENGSTYHFATVITTDSTSGLTTLKVYGNNTGADINTSTDTALVTKTFYIDASVVTELFGTGTWGLNSSGSSTLSGEVDYDLLRVYNSDPILFSAVPESTTMAFTLLSGVILSFTAYVSHKKRQAVCV